jgi:hypothetical protein
VNFYVINRIQCFIIFQKRKTSSEKKSLVCFWTLIFPLFEFMPHSTERGLGLGTLHLKKGPNVGPDGTSPIVLN